MLLTRSELRLDALPSFPTKLPYSPPREYMPRVTVGSVGRWMAALALLGILAPRVAQAKCGNDLECKGDRVCEDGTCVSPKGSAAEGPKPGAGDRQPKSDSTRFWSADVSLALGIREGSGASPAVPGAGVLLGFEFKRFVAMVEFLVPWSFRNNLAGIGFGLGAVFPISDAIDLLLVGMAGSWETIATNGTYEAAWGPTERQFRTHDYLVAFPHVRFGRRLHVAIGPRIAFGTYTTIGELDSEGETVTFTLSSQIGWRF